MTGGARSTVLGYRPSDWLDALTERAAGLAQRLAVHAAGDALDDLRPGTVGGERRRAGLLATLQLDGSPIEVLPAPDVLLADVAGSNAAAPAPATTRGTWFDAMRAFDDPPDDELLQAEARGVASGLLADDLAGLLAADAQTALAELHRRLTAGLVVPERAGQLRHSEQAVHDASVGRIIYFAADPAQLAPSFQALATWLAGPAGDLPALHAAGLLHLELLRLHPFDAANGRLARAAARLWLRAGGLDPAGLAVPELLLADDPLGYHEEVASTLRRGEATIWLERWAEAVVAGLRGSLRDHEDPAPTDAAEPDRLGRLPAEFTLADARTHLQAEGGNLADLRARLGELEDAGRVEVVAGTRGLRFRRHPG